MKTRLQQLFALLRPIVSIGSLCLITSCGPSSPSSSSNVITLTPAQGERLAALAGISGTYFEGFYGDDPETLSTITVTLMRYSDSKFWNGLTWGASFDLLTTHVAVNGQYGDWQLAPGTVLPTGNDLNTGLVDDFYYITASATFSGSTKKKNDVTLFSVGAQAPPVLPAPWAWGRNTEGQLGSGGPLNTNPPSRVFTYGALDGKIIASLAAGGTHTLALTGDGLVYAWGSDTSGQLGADPVQPPDPHGSRFWQPVKVDDSGVLSGKRIVSIAAGGAHSLAASLDDGQVFAWGSDYDGQIGDGGTFGSSVKAEVPVAVAGLLAGKRVIAVAAGSSHSMALTDEEDGRKVYAWGSNTIVRDGGDGYGMLGDGTLNPRSIVPVAVTGLGGVRIAAIACGGMHTLALTDNGKLYAWGAGDSGQLGNGGTADSNVPLLISGPWGTKKLVAVSAGVTHSLAVDEDGKVYAWGDNNFGPLGLGDQVNRLTPVEVTALTGQFVVQVQAGSSYSLAWTRDNKVFSWGDDRDGVLIRSHPPYAYALTPGEADLSAALAGGHVILGLSAGARHVALLTGFSVKPEPEIEVEAQGAKLTDGATINCGTFAVGTSNPVWITIHNSGRDNLSDLTGLSVSLADTNFHATFSQPSLAPNGETGFYVWFAPNATGALNSAVQILSNDADENPFDINLIGTATPMGQLDTAFDPDVLGNVFSTSVQPDGKVVIGGAFVRVNGGGGPARNYAARVDGSTGVADTFDPQLGSYDYCSLVLPDGKVMVGGFFDTVGGTTRKRLARLNPGGTLDTGYDAQILFSGTVYAMAMQGDGKLVVSGNFTSIGGTGQQYLARLNPEGTVDTAFAPSLNSIGRGVAVQSDGSIVVLTSLSASERTVARLSGVDGSLDPGFTRPTIITNGNALLDCVAVQPDGKILVGGSVQTVNGETRNGMCRINTDGSLDMSFNPDVNGRVTSIVVQANKRILISGDFTSVGGQPRNRIAMLNPGGSLEPYFDPNANSSVLGIALQADGKVLACGGFTNIAGQPRSNLARLSNDTATQSLHVANGTVIWERGGASPETNVVTFDVSGDGGTTWTPVGPGVRMSPSTPGWQLTGATMPGTGHIRARAFPQGGYYSGSVSLLETIAVYGTPPEITVTEGVAPVLTGATRDFGVVATGSSSVVLQLTIQNTGGTTLEGLGSTTLDDDLAVTGDHRSQFQLVRPAANALAPGATTTMSVAYQPKTTGRHAAILRIPSNDANENPFGIFITGLGSEPIATHRQQKHGDSANEGAGADTADTDGNGQSEQQEYATGTDAVSTVGDGTSISPPTGGGFAPFANGEANDGPPSGGTFLFNYQRNKLALADIIFQVEWSDTLAENDWHTTGVTEEILSDDDHIQQIQATVPAGTSGRRFARLKITRP